MRCSLKTCVQRDPKGLYKKAIDGKITVFTGINAPYEDPFNPEIIMDTEYKSVKDGLQLIVDKMRSEGIIKK